MSAALPCIACGRALPDAIPGERENQPYGGTAFGTPGHYGSTVFDPMDDTALEINVCDTCLVAAAKKGAVLHHGYRRGRKHSAPWKAPKVTSALAETGEA